MTSLVQGTGNVGGISSTVQTLIELRAQSALFQAIEGTNQEGQVNMNQLRLDAAFELGAPASAVIQE